MANRLFKDAIYFPVLIFVVSGPLIFVISVLRDGVELCTCTNNTTVRALGWILVAFLSSVIIHISLINNHVHTIPTDAMRKVQVKLCTSDQFSLNKNPANILFYRFPARWNRK